MSLDVCPPRPPLGLDGLSWGTEWGRREWRPRRALSAQALAPSLWTVEGEQVWGLFALGFKERHLSFFPFIAPPHSRAVGSRSVSFHSDMSLGT